MKQEEMKRRAQELVSSLRIRNSAEEMDHEVEEAVCKIVEAILPKLEGDKGRKELLQSLSKLTEWIDKMPRSLHPDKCWSREEFDAVLAGPTEESDPQFGDYMDSFYEEYMDNAGNEVTDFYDKLFQNEQQINEVDWISLWESVRSSYENWLKTEEEDEWLRGEKIANFSGTLKA